MFHYIHRLDLTEVYNFIFFGTNEYRGIYSSELYYSVTLLVNQGIYHITDEHFNVSCSVIKKITSIVDLPGITLVTLLE
jgi:hypothetical protein